MSNEHTPVPEETPELPSAEAEEKFTFTAAEYLRHAAGNLHQGALVLDVVMLVSYIDPEDGEMTLSTRTTEGMSIWSKLGMLDMAQTSLRKRIG